jgi:ubiquitin carboxyl-terminal hydrolase 15
MSYMQEQVTNKDAHMEEFEFYLKNEWGDGQQQKIEISDLDLLKTEQSRLQVNVHWKQNALRKYDTSMLNSIPEIHKLELVPEGTEDSVALDGCLEAFLKEEPLGPDDMW